MNRDRRLAIATGFAVCLIFFGIEWQRGGLLLRPFDVGLAIVLSASALAALGRRRWRKLPWSPMLAVYAVLALYTVLNALVQTSSARAVTELVQAVELIAFTLLVAVATSSSAARRAFLWALLTGATAIGVYSALYHVSQAKYFDFKDMTSPRYVFAIVAALSVTAWLCRPVGFAGFWARRPVVVGSVLLMLLSGDRKGWVAFAVTVALVNRARRRVGRPRTRRPASDRPSTVRPPLGYALLAMLVLAIPLGNVLLPEGSYTERQLESLANAPLLLFDDTGTTEAVSSSNERRTVVLRAAGAEFMAHPVFGLGPERFKEEITRRVLAQGVVAANPHNWYVKTAVETGIIGLLLAGTLVVLTIASAMRLVRAGGDRFELMCIYALTIYGVTVNLFLAGGVLNVLHLLLPVGLIQGAMMERRRRQQELSTAPVGVRP